MCGVVWCGVGGVWCGGVGGGGVGGGGVGAVLVRCWCGVGAVLVRCWCGVGAVLVRCAVCGVWCVVCGVLWLVVVVLTVCMTKMSVHERQRSSTELWEPCPCGHGSRPCTCVQGPKKNPPQPKQCPTSATVGARLTSPRRHLWTSHDRHNRDNEHLVMNCNWGAGPWESASASRHECR